MKYGTLMLLQISQGTAGRAVQVSAPPLGDEAPSLIKKKTSAGLVSYEVSGVRCQGAKVQGSEVSVVRDQYQVSSIQKDNMISIVIAAYNEEQRIGTSLLKVKDYLDAQNFVYEIIVVDDGSTDNTKQVAMGYRPEISNLKIISYPNNKGKGFALRQGVLASNGESVLISDADLSTPIEELSFMLPLISSREHGVVIGSRALNPETIIIKQPWWRQGMGKVFNRIVRLLVLEGFKDTQCGFKLFSGEAARTLFKNARVDRFAYDVEILALAKKRNYRVSEVPVRWLNSPASKVHPIFDSLQMLFDLVKIRLRIGKEK